VASFFDSAVYQFDADTGALQATLVAPNTASPLSGPAGMTIGPDNNLYISSQFNDAIVRLDPTTGNLSTFIPSSVLDGQIAAAGNTFAPAGLRFGPDGNLYVSQNGGQSSTSGAVVRFNITNTGGVLSYDSSATNFTVIATTGLIQPAGLAFGTAAGDTHTLYVSNSGTQEVDKITGADGASPVISTFVAAGSGGLNFPSGLFWGADGKMYVVDLGAT